MCPRYYIFFVCTAVFWSATSEELSTNNVGEMLRTYENYINASLTLDKTDRELVNTWQSEFLVKQVNITSHYRLDMTRHREQAFRGKKTYPGWRDCVSLHQKEIKMSKASYFDSESECLRISNTADRDTVAAVRQVEKEIRKWRKSYKYLAHTCRTDNPDDSDAANLCLVVYVKRDNYDVVFQRLIILKLESMDKLLQQMNSGLRDLEECLKNTLLEFLNTIRNIVGTLNMCNDIITSQASTEIEKNVNIEGGMREKVGI